MSGEHSSDFWDFCNKRVVVYYLHLATQLRESGREFCSSNFYVEDEFDSTNSPLKTARSLEAPQKKLKSNPVTPNNELMTMIATSLAKMAEAEEKESAHVESDRLQGFIARLEASIDRVQNQLNTIEQKINLSTSSALNANGNSDGLYEMYEDRERMKKHLKQLQIKLEGVEMEWIK